MLALNNIFKSNVRYKFILALLICFFCLFTLGKAYAINVVKPTNDFYINDYANVLDNSLKRTILEKSLKLYNENDIQIVVLTINSLNGASVEEYGNTFYNNNQIGSKEKDGVLILLSVEDRKIRVEVGDHLEGILPDSKVGRILDQYAVPYLKNNDWNGGISSLYNTLYEFLSSGELELNDDEIDEKEYMVYAYGAIASAVIGMFSFLFKKFTAIPFAIVLGVEYYFLSFKGSFTLPEFLGISVFYLFALLFGIMFVNRGRERSVFSRGGSSSHSGGGGHSSGGGASRGF